MLPPIASEYNLEFRKFISSQYLYAGVRITAGVVIPAIILHQYGLLAPLISIPLGALFVSLTDNPGPVTHRRNGMIASIILNTLVVLLAGYARHDPGLVGFYIVVFGLLFSMTGVYGTRAGTIGVIALVVFIVHIDGSAGLQPHWKQALQFGAGGTWYCLLSLGLYTLRPYRPIQQLLGECFMEIAAYIRSKSMLFRQHSDAEKVYEELMQHQVKIHKLQDELREILFKTRRIVAESTTRSRILMMGFLDSLDLFERVMTAQQDYQQLLSDTGDTGIPEKISTQLLNMAEALHRVGVALQSGYVYNSAGVLETGLQEITNEFMKLRKERMNPGNIEGFIRLRQVLYNVQDLTARIRRLEQYTAYDKKVAGELKEKKYREQYTNEQEINLRLFISAISLQSGMFRHACRLTVALVAGFLVSLFFPVGHGYWILLTIVTIIKPAYSITRKRNVERLTGTVIGASMGFFILFYLKNDTWIFVIMLISMVTAYSLLRVNFFVSSIAITILIMCSVHFINPADFDEVLHDRIIDTVIGSAIAWLVSLFVLPVWESEKIDDLVKKALIANREYFSQAAASFTGAMQDEAKYSQARKEAFVALANVSDAFQRMLTEPKGSQSRLRLYHQFVAASHILTSQIASLSYYAQRFKDRFQADDFKPLVRQIDKRFSEALAIHEGSIEKKPESAIFPIEKRVQKLLGQRQSELTEGFENGQESVRRELADLKTITDQFRLIHANLLDESKILQQLK